MTAAQRFASGRGACRQTDLSVVCAALRCAIRHEWCCMLCAACCINKDCARVLGLAVRLSVGLVLSRLQARVPPASAAALADDVALLRALVCAALKPVGLSLSFGSFGTRRALPLAE